MKTFYTFTCLLLLVLIMSGCKKLVDARDPEIATSVTNVYSTDATAAAVLTGIYINMSNSNATEFARGGFSSLSLFPGLSADELSLVSGAGNTYTGFYTNELSPEINPFTAPDYWKTIYPIIFTVNSAIEGLEASTTLTQAVKKQLLGEAKFMRAFCYFYLVNLYGDVPLVLSSDWKVNAALSRTTAQQVYQQLVADLKEAQGLLSENYLNADISTPNAQRVRPTKWAADALLARLYLYMGNWVAAEAQATKVIVNTTNFYLADLYSGFSFYSGEIIWSLKAVGKAPNSNTGEGMVFILPFYGPSPFSNPVYLNNDLVNSFEPDDQRRVNWVGQVDFNGSTYYYPYKYKLDGNLPYSLEYPVVLRLAEQYLIRAEARAHQENISGAQEDLNVIRTRAGLSNTLAADKSTLLNAIMQERRVELFTEWGHRWFDLKRTGKVNEVMTAAATAKGSSWQSTDQLYPIPASEIKLAPQLLQNPGYH